MLNAADDCICGIHARDSWCLALCRYLPQKPPGRRSQHPHLGTTCLLGGICSFVQIGGSKYIVLMRTFGFCVRRSLDQRYAVNANILLDRSKTGWRPFIRSVSSKLSKIAHAGGAHLSVSSFNYFLKMIYIIHLLGSKTASVWTLPGVAWMYMCVPFLFCSR